MPVDKQRILRGLGVGALAVVSLGFVPVGNPVALVIVLLLGGLAMHEFYGLLAAGGLPASRKWGTAHGLLFVAATWLCIRQGWPDDLLWSLLVLSVFSTLLRHLTIPDVNRALRMATGTMLGFIYVAFFWSFMVRVLMIDGALQSPGWPGFYLVLVVKLGDTGAYFVGTRFGKHRMAPRISPKKSWEGLAGGIAASMLASLGWWLLSDGRLGALAFPLPHALILGAVLHLIGTAGDLVESLFKRAVDLKDSSTMIHGMGGVLDILDSLLFAAPFLYIYVYAFLK